MLNTRRGRRLPASDESPSLSHDQGSISAGKKSGGGVEVFGRIARVDFKPFSPPLRQNRSAFCSKKLSRKLVTVSGSFVDA